MSRPRPSARLAAEWWLVLIGVAGLVAALAGWGGLERADMVLYDALARRATRAPRPDIVLVTIDDRSLAELGPWPWPRATEARLVANLARARPRAIALDLLLRAPGDPAGDAALAEAIGAAPTFLPMQFEVPGPNGAPFASVPPLARFGAAAAGVGHANLLPDADGIVRRLYLAYGDGAGHWPHLMTLVAGMAPAVPPLTDGEGLVAQAPAMIAFVGPQGSFPAVPAASVVRGEVPPEVFAGKRVLVGMTASGVGDAYATPAGSDRSLMPGIEIQANLLDSLLSGRAVRPVTGLALALASALPAVMMMLGLRWLRPAWMPWLALGLLAAVLGAVFLALAGFGLWLAPASALLGLLLVQPAWHWRRLAAVSAEIGARLERFEAERDPLERPRPDLAGADFLDRQLGLLDSAIEREHDLRRFLVDRIEQMPDAVLVADRGGRIVIANGAARALWASLDGNGEPAALAPLLARLDCAPGDPLAGWAAEAATADGRSFAILAEPQRAADDSVIGSVVRLADVTAARLAQHQREEVLQLLSHDMRSPQVSILALLDRGEVPPGLAGQLRGHATRTLRMADGFVQLARAQSLEFVAEPIDLVGIAQEAEDAVWPQASARGIRVAAELPEAEIAIAGDRSLLMRMLVNLLDNAIRHSEPGQSVRIGLAREGDEAVLTVADEGAGMAEEQRARLFERFASGSITAGPGGGVGLGLAYVRTAVARHGGRIVCESAPGAGTRFILRFPALAADA